MALSRITRAGNYLQAAGQRIVLHGMNDTDVFPTKCLYLRGIGGNTYLPRNNLFPSTPGGDLPCMTIDEFFWKYFWLMRYYGMNLLRTSDGYGYGVMRELFYNFRPKWDGLMASMLKMAEWNRVYVSFGLGSPQGYSAKQATETDAELAARVAAWEADNAFKPDSPKYNEFVKFCKDVVSTEVCKRSPAVAFWEYANEPDGDWTYDHWWKLQGPTKVEAEAAWQAWAIRLVNDIRSADHSHLDTIGVAAGKFHGYGQADFLNANSNPSDIAHEHIYGRRVTYDWNTGDYFYKMRQWADSLNKPVFMGEYGYDCWQKCTDPNNADYDTYHNYLPVEISGAPWVRSPYRQLYSRWDTQVLYETGCDAMTSMMIPYYPNWPPTQSVLDSIPPIPASDPNPDAARVVDAEAYRAMIAMLR